MTATKKGPAAPNQASDQGGPSQPIRCAADGCKTMDLRFGFCPEHYEQFKFGLINRLGKKVPDYEKKFDHYQAFRTRSMPGSVKKAA